MWKWLVLPRVMPWYRSVSRRMLSSFHMFPMVVVVQPSDEMHACISSLRGWRSSGFSARWYSTWVTTCSYKMNSDYVRSKTSVATLTWDEVWIAVKLSINMRCAIVSMLSPFGIALSKTNCRMSFCRLCFSSSSTQYSMLHTGLSLHSSPNS